MTPIDDETPVRSVPGPEVRLACAVLAQALEEARRGDPRAAWLAGQSDGVRFWAHVAGLDPAALRRAVGRDGRAA